MSEGQVIFLSNKVKRVNCFGLEVWLKMEQDIFKIFSKKQRELVIDFVFYFLSPDVLRKLVIWAANA